MIEVHLVAVAPVKAHPAHALENGVDVLLILLDGIGVVKAHVAVAAVVFGKPEVEADALDVPDVKVPVGLGRKARADARDVLVPSGSLLTVGRGMTAPQTGPVAVGLKISLNDAADEIGRTRAGVLLFFFVIDRIGHSLNVVSSKAIAAPEGVAAGAIPIPR